VINLFGSLHIDDPGNDSGCDEADKVVNVEVRKDAVVGPSCVTPHTLAILPRSPSENVWNDPNYKLIHPMASHLLPIWQRFPRVGAGISNVVAFAWTCCDTGMMARRGDRQPFLEALE
jgi:hypothetical protein